MSLGRCGGEQLEAALGIGRDAFAAQQVHGGNEPRAGIGGRRTIAGPEMEGEPTLVVTRLLRRRAGRGHVYLPLRSGFALPPALPRLLLAPCFRVVFSYTGPQLWEKRTMSALSKWSGANAPPSPD